LRHIRHVSPYLGDIATERLKRPVVTRYRLGHLRQQLVNGPKVGAIAAH
jgi:hypothetical protein